MPSLRPIAPVAEPGRTSAILQASPHRERLLLLALLAAVVAALCAVTSVGIASLDAGRALLRAEAAYVNAWGVALGHLDGAVRSNDLGEFSKFEADLVVPLASRTARLALQRGAWAEARAALLRAGTTPADADAIVRLGRLWGWTPAAARYFARTSERDRGLLELRALGHHVSGEILGGDLTPAEVEETLRHLSRAEVELQGHGGALREIVEEVAGAIRVGVLTSLLLSAIIILGLAALVANRLVRRVEHSEAWFRSLFDATPDATYVFRLDDEGAGSFVALNRTALGRYGYTPDELQRLSPMDLLAPPLPDVRAELDQLRRGECVLFRAVHRTRDAREIPVEIHAVPREHGGERYVFSTVRDVSARVEAERALQESEAWFRATFENAAVGVAHVSPSGLWVRVNARLAELLGYAPEELRERSFQELTHPDDLPEEIVLARQLLQGEIPHYTLEKRFCRKDGAVVWANVSVSSFRLVTGEPVFIQVVQDVTARKEAEVALRESEERFREVGENVDVVLWMADAATDEVLFISPNVEALAGIGRDRFLHGRFTFATVHEEDRQRAREAYTRAKTEGRQEVEYRVVRPDGEVRHVRSAAFPIRRADGTVYRLAGSTQDITEHVCFREERAARERAEEALRVRTALLHGVSEELRTPLTAILGFASLLGDGVSDEEQQEYAGVIVQNAQQLGDAIDGLLELAQLETDELPMIPRAVDFVRTAEEVVVDLQPVAMAKGLHAFVTSSHRGAPGQSDPKTLRRVLHALVENAIRFTERGGVHVHVEVAADAVEFRVHDTGIGIDPDVLPYLFEGGHRRFSSAGSIRLSLVKRLAESLGGGIDVASTPGVGTRFTVRLPRVVRPSESKEARASTRLLEPLDGGGALPAAPRAGGGILP